MQWDCVRGVRLLWAVEVRGAVLAEGSLDRAWKDSRIGKRGEGKACQRTGVIWAKVREGA